MINTVQISVQEYDRLRKSETECHRLRQEKEPKIAISLYERKSFSGFGYDLNKYEIKTSSDVLPENLSQEFKEFIKPIDHTIKESNRLFENKIKSQFNQISCLEIDRERVQSKLDKIPNWIKKWFL